MGTAAAWALAKRGLKPLVLEQFQHVHDQGSHGGDTRVIRHAYAESPEYVPLVLHADRLWQELESQTGHKSWCAAVAWNWPHPALPMLARHARAPTSTDSPTNG